MDWQIKITQKTEKLLNKLDKPIQKRIIDFLYNRLKKIPDPRILGGTLEGEYKGFWKYRIGEYRLICDIQDNILNIVLINVGHRKDVYK